MIADLEPYPEYKGSGLPWVGQVPGHWAQERAKWLFTKMDRPVREGDEVVTCFRDGRVTLRRNRRLRGFTEATAFSGYQGIRKGDLVIHGMDAFAGAIGVSDSDGKGTPVYSVCQPRPGVSARYYAHLVRQMSQSQWILALAKGIRERSTDFRFEMFGNQRVPLPPPDEQAAIVRFLDWATGRLDRAIRAKRKVIALLNEQKQAIIHRAVTRGLDPSVPLKPSGIAWLGDIPQHWEVRQLRRLTKYGTTITYGIVQAGPDIENGVPYIRTSDMKGQVLPRSGYLRTSWEIDSAYQRSKVEAGDLVVAIRATLGKGLLVPEYLAGANLTQGTARVSPSEALSSEFLCYAFNSSYCQKSIRCVAKGTTFLEITLEALRQIPLAIPPLPEQQQLAVAISEQTHPLSALVARTEHEITLLLEYRTRLVSDVVTGKLDVRAAAARLPDQLEEPGQSHEGGIGELEDEEGAEIDLDEVAEEAGT